MANRADSGSPSSLNDGGPIPDDDQHEAEMPMTMAASVVLTALPRDASSALRNAGELQQEKITVRFQPVGSAPALRQRVFKVSSKQRFETVVNFLRKKLGLNAAEGIFCYINSVFSPGLDENVGNLWRCFKAGEELVISYAQMPAFG